MVSVYTDAMDCLAEKTTLEDGWAQGKLLNSFSPFWTFP